MSYEVSLLRGTPIHVDSAGLIYPLRLSEIEEIGIERYQESLNYVLFSKSSIEDESFQEKVEAENLSDFDVSIIVCLADNNFKTKYLESLEVFFRKKVLLHEEGFFYLGDFEDQCYIHRGNFDQVIEVIRMQNMLTQKKEEKAKAANKATEDIMKKLMWGRKQSGSKEKKDGLTLDKIISIVASNSPTLNHLNIWDYTIYQLYEYFNRMMKRDSFEQQFNLLLQGADIKSSDLVHWAT